MQEIAARQAPLLQALDILSPSLYVWYQAYPDGFDRAVARFPRQAFLGPEGLLFLTSCCARRSGRNSCLVGSYHDRKAGEDCPAQSGGHRYWATVRTYSGKSGPSDLRPTVVQPGAVGQSCLR